MVRDPLRRVVSVSLTLWIKTLPGAGDLQLQHSMGGFPPEPPDDSPLVPPACGTPAAPWAYPAGPGVLEALRLPVSGVARPPGLLPRPCC
eukprot:9703214-Alexandrium_andersonii.AAC.1